LNTAPILNDILKELERAERLHSWEGYDILHMTAKVSGEGGEALREANKIHEGGGSLAALRIEVVQTAATCVRLLKNL